MKNKDFYLLQLEESGLTEEDVLAYVVVDDPEHRQWLSTMYRGGFNQIDGSITNDDDMVIAYYDLYGNEEKYTPKRGKKMMPYRRVRHAFPEMHTNMEGKPMKYQTPAGAQSLFFYPEYIRKAFNAGDHIETLFIQEGEKKALKACKHGVPSIAIQGIGNIGSKNTGLIHGLKDLVESCSIKNIVLLLDADWNDLSKNLEDGERVDKRPLSFAGAVLKFKTYIQSLHNAKLDVDIMFAHINENANDDKGCDDLLVNTLRGKEDELKKDIEFALHEINGIGKYISIHKITTASEYKIKDFWDLNNHENFFETHKSRLMKLPTFKIGISLYKVMDGRLARASHFKGDRELWYTEFKSNGSKKAVFDHVEANKFLIENGFCRFKTIDCDKNSWKLVHIVDNIIYEVSAYDVRDYVYDYAQETCKEKVVHQMLIYNLGKYLSDSQLERLPLYIDDNACYQPNEQLFVFNNGMLTVSDQGAVFGPINKHVWESNVIKRSFSRVNIIENITKEDGSWRMDFTEDGLRCDFLRFIINTSNFFDKPFTELTPEQLHILASHIVNKITAIGYLLCDYKYQTELKSIIAMDGEMGDVAQSNGRTGKSLIGKAISFFREQTYIDGRNTDNDDQFIFSLVTPNSRNIFYDDVKVNFDFDRFFAAITGDLNVNPKRGSRFVISNARSPKFYITTNHAINANSKSAEARITYMEFSNWYNDTHCPVDDFGHQFFNDWDKEQWNLFDNLMAECVHYYFKSLSCEWYRKGQGAVAPPMEHIRLRQYKQRMGEVFYQWAEAYFDPSGQKLNHSIKRTEMQLDFFNTCPEHYGVTATNFKRRLLEYCRFKGYHFNPNTRNVTTKEDFSDWITKNLDESFEGECYRSNGAEYFFVVDSEYYKTHF